MTHRRECAAAAVQKVTLAMVNHVGRVKRAMIVRASREFSIEFLFSFLYVSRADLSLARWNCVKL